MDAEIKEHGADIHNIPENYTVKDPKSIERSVLLIAQETEQDLSVDLAREDILADAQISADLATLRNEAESLTQETLEALRLAIEREAAEKEILFHVNKINDFFADLPEHIGTPQEGWGYILNKGETLFIQLQKESYAAIGQNITKNFTSLGFVLGHISHPALRMNLRKETLNNYVNRLVEWPVTEADLDFINHQQRELLGSRLSEQESRDMEVDTQERKKTIWIKELELLAKKDFSQALEACLSERGSLILESLPEGDPIFSLLGKAGYDFFKQNIGKNYADAVAVYQRVPNSIFDKINKFPDQDASLPQLFLSAAKEQIPHNIPDDQKGELLKRNLEGVMSLFLGTHLLDDIMWSEEVLTSVIEEPIPREKYLVQSVGIIDCLRTADSENWSKEKIDTVFAYYLVHAPAEFLKGTLHNKQIKNFALGLSIDEKKRLSFLDSSQKKEVGISKGCLFLELLPRDEQDFIIEEAFEKKKEGILADYISLLKNKGDATRLLLFAKKTMIEPIGARINFLLFDSLKNISSTDPEFLEEYLNTIFLTSAGLDEQSVKDFDAQYGGVLERKKDQLISRELTDEQKKNVLKNIVCAGFARVEDIDRLVAGSPELLVDILGEIKQIDGPESFWNFFDLLKKYDVPSREGQIFVSFMMSQMIEKGCYDIFDLDGGEQVNGEKFSEKLKDFITSFDTGGKGKTIITLLAAREFGSITSKAEFRDACISEVEKYMKLLLSVDDTQFPEGIRASIGMEYEVSASIAEEGYVGMTGAKSGEYKKHILEISKHAGIGQGNDAVHEIATRPTNNPYAMLLEMQLLEDLEFIDFNFEKPGFEKGGRGYHLTIGGEQGVRLNEQTNVLQNMLIIAGWGGVNAGNTLSQLSRGRDLNIRERGVSSSQLGGAVQVFEREAPAVELRALSIDRKEPFERSVMSSYFGSVAIQAMERYTGNIPLTNERLIALFPEGIPDDPEDTYTRLKDGESHLPVADNRVKQIIHEWVKTISETLQYTNEHNEQFYANEVYGYIDGAGMWVDAEVFGGKQNEGRFESVAKQSGFSNIEDYIEKTKIAPNTLFEAANVQMANTLTAINNLFIKPSLEQGGDRANGLALLETTKLANDQVENSKGVGLTTSLLNTNGKGREGYYSLQGGSERMLVHGVQKSLLRFNKRMGEILFSK